MMLFYPDIICKLGRFIFADDLQNRGLSPISQNQWYRAAEISTMYPPNTVGTPWTAGNDLTDCQPTGLNLTLCPLFSHSPHHMYMRPQSAARLYVAKCYSVQLGIYHFQ